MTLNIMLTSRHGVYLTGDFRLKYSDGHVEDDLFAQKLVPVVKFEWCALIAFCGIAKTSTGLDVGDWLSNAVHVNERKESVDAFIGRLQTADKWLSGLRGERGLTISVVGFNRRRPFAAVLSNSENAYGKRFPKILPHLQIFRWKPKDIELRLFGDPASISVHDKQHLKNLLRKNQSGALKTALGDANRRASEKSTVISAQCVVGCLLPTGDGEILVHGIDPYTEYIPRFVQREMCSAGVEGFQCKTGPNGRPLNPHWKGMTIKVQGKLGKDARLGTLHAISNVERAIGTAKNASFQVYQKIAGPNEPERYTFSTKRR